MFKIECLKLNVPNLASPDLSPEARSSPDHSPEARSSPDQSPETQWNLQSAKARVSPDEVPEARSTAENKVIFIPKIFLSNEFLY